MNQNKILLIHIHQSERIFASSPYLQMQIFPQMGLLYLASVLRKGGYDPEYLDTAFTPFTLSSFRDKISQNDFLFIGFYTNISIKNDVCSLIKTLRTYSQVPVLVGGPGFFEAEYYFNAGANMVVGGEAENIILPLTERILNGLSPEGIPGVLLPGKFSLDTLSIAPPVTDLDSLPYPAWDLAPPKALYNHLSFFTQYPFYSVMASRGCSMSCAFCYQMYKKEKNRYRLRNPEKVIEEMSYLYHHFGVKHIKFQDDNFGADREWLDHFLDLFLESGLKLQWNCSMHPIFFKKDGERLLQKMKKTGCVCVHFGIQSSSPSVLKSVHRSPEEPEILLHLTPLMKKMGFYTIIDFIYGLPEDTTETLQNNLSFALKSETNMIQVNPFVMVPRTPLFEKYGTHYPSNTSAEEIQSSITRTNRRFFLRPVFFLETFLYILKNNPRYLFKIFLLFSFGLKLFLGKFKIAKWQFKKMEESISASPGKS